MAISFVAAGTQTDSGVSSSDTCNYPAGLVAGDLVLLVVGACASGNAGTDDSYTLPGGWTQIGTRQRREVGTWDLLIDIWYQFAVGGETTFTMSSIGANLQGDVTNTGVMNTTLAWRGVDPTTPFDGVTPTQGDAAPELFWDPPTITPATDGAWVISTAVANDNTAMSHTTPGVAEGFTLRASGTAYDTQTAADMALGVSDKPGTNGVAETMNRWGQISNDSWVGITLVIRELAGAPTHLLTSGSTTDATSYVTASITPSANKLILVSVGSSTATTADAPTVTGNGLTYVEVISIADPASVRLTVFRAMGASPSAGALTIDFAGATQTACHWSVTEFDGVDTSGTDGSGAIAQAVTSSSSSTTGSVTLAAFGSANNATYGAFQHSANEYHTAGSGFTMLGQFKHVTPSRGTSTEWRNDNDTTVDATWATSANWRAIGVEIAAAAVGGGQPSSRRMGGVQSASIGMPRGGGMRRW